MRPSCGRRFSAMSMPPMIFMRATNPSWTHFGRSITSFNNPSRRCRTTTLFSVGSMWMSLARLLSALLMTRSTRSMIGAVSGVAPLSEVCSNTSSSTRRGARPECSEIGASIPPGVAASPGCPVDRAVTWTAMPEPVWFRRASALSGYDAWIESTIS